MLNFRFGATAAALAFAVAASAAAPASASVIVGSNNSGNCYPLLCNDSGTDTGVTMDYQQVYSASAFSGPITINSVTFFFAPGYGGTSTILSGDYELYLSYAANPVGSLSATLADNISGAQTLFASGHSDGTEDTNPSFTVFGGPFDYDPANGDLLMEIIASNQAIVPNGSGNGYLQADDSTAVTSRVYCVAGSDCTPDTAGLVTEFNADGTVPEPLTLSLVGAGLAGMAAARRARKKHA